MAEDAFEEDFFDFEGKMVAYHEAAHAVIAWSLGLQVAGCKLFDTAGAGVVTISTEYAYTDTAGLLMLLAGYAASRRLGKEVYGANCPARFGEDASPDYKEAHEIAKRFVGNNRQQGAPVNQNIRGATARPCRSCLCWSAVNAGLNLTRARSASRILIGAGALP